MAVQLEQTAHFDRSAPTTVRPLTVMCWVQVTTWPADTPYEWATVVYLGSTSHADWISLYIDNDGPETAYLDDSNGDIAETTDTIGIERWVFLAAAMDDDDSSTLYWRFEEDSALSSVAGTFTGTYLNQRIMIGNDPSTSGSKETLSGSVAYARLFFGLLTESEILAESQAETAVLSANADWPMADASGDDVSGNDRHLTPVEGTGSFTVVADPNITGVEPPNEGLAVFMANVNLTGAGTGDYSGTTEFGLDVNMEAAGIAPPIPTGSTQFSVDMTVEGTGGTLYQGATDFDLGVKLTGPILHGPLVTEDIDLPGVITDLPEPVRVSIWLVDSNRDFVHGFVTSFVSDGSEFVIVPPHDFDLNLVTSIWRRNLTPNSHITPAGTLYKRVLYMRDSPVAVDFFEVPDEDGPFVLPDLVLS